jgi:hypothetical protein
MMVVTHASSIWTAMNVAAKSRSNSRASLLVYDTIMNMVENKYSHDITHIYPSGTHDYETHTSHTIANVNGI